MEPFHLLNGWFPPVVGYPNLVKGEMPKRLALNAVCLSQNGFYFHTVS